MKYRFHEDVVYTKVSGVPLLVTLRGSWDRFPAIRQLTPLQGCFCQGIIQKMDEDELVDAIRLSGNKKKIHELYCSFTSNLLQEGSLVPENMTDMSEDRKQVTADSAQESIIHGS